MASPHSAPAEVRWRLVPAAIPRALRPCAGCGRIQPFVSSGRFRLNAHKRRIDVWLVYRCAECEHTWNLEILARVPTDEVDPSERSAFLRNDAETAARYACDGPRLIRAGARPETSDGFALERPDGEWPGPHEGGPDIRVACERGCVVRLDRLLAQGLGLTRSAVLRAIETGTLRLEPGGPAALRRAVRDGLRISGAPTGP